MENTLNGMTPEEWLKFNYNLILGNRIVLKDKSAVIVKIKQTDNIGHFRTKYPVVIGIDGDRSIDWMTLEAVNGF